MTGEAHLFRWGGISEKAAEKAGIERTRLHNLRHSAVFWFVEFSRKASTGRVWSTASLEWSVRPRPGK
jgi:hypothetical protein